MHCRSSMLVRRRRDEWAPLSLDVTSRRAAGASGCWVVWRLDGLDVTIDFMMDVYMGGIC